MIPKFIFGEDVSGEREFIIHAHEPIIKADDIHRDTASSDFEKACRFIKTNIAPESGTNL